MAAALLPFNELGAPLRHAAPGSDLPFDPCPISPFDFKRLRAARRALPQSLPARPIPAPILSPEKPVSAPVNFDPFKLSEADAAAMLDSAPEVDEREAFDGAAEQADVLEVARLSYLADRTAEAKRLGEIPDVIRERWIEKPRNAHFCARCFGDIDYGERHLCQSIRTPEGTMRSDRVCDHCSNGGRSGGGSNADRNGTGIYNESGGDGRLCRIPGIGGQAARTKRGGS